MDTTKVLSQLDQLDDEIDDLEESLAPLLKSVLSETASKLPLLDKAKLYTLVTYAIESMLFSYLRLNGVKARDHPVFTELTRVKQYFDKIKTAETPVGKRQNLSLDKKAAARIITAGLSGNDKYDLQRAEQQAKERARAHIKFNELTQKMEAREKVKDPQTQDDIADSSDDSKSESSGDVKATPATPKKRKLGNAQTGQDSSIVTAEALKGDSDTAKSARKRKKAKTEKTKAKKHKKSK